VRFAIYCANFGRLGEPAVLVDLALRAEQAGWDGFFVYDHIVIEPGRAVRSADPWSVLAVVADRTGLWLGPMVTPVARRQPWELAHQAIAVDRLSDGRLILGVGLGEPMDHDTFGGPAEPAVLGARLDEGLDIVTRLLAGETVDHEGTWTLRGAALAPGPVAGSIPVWVAGRWPNRAPVRRAARYAGMFPIDPSWDLADMLTPEQLATMGAWIAELRGGLDGYDLVTAGVSSAGGSVAPYAAAGVTWWLEVLEPRRGSLEELRARVAAGPPQR
jgi:alkanesulfonate monooxygenase SsuD/methylene tetrahydromethanopterin reductase-like flavin-dependent oxidoreductase (luciferase family)